MVIYFFLKSWFLCNQLYSKLELCKRKLIKNPDSGFKKKTHIKATTTDFANGNFHVVPIKAYSIQNFLDVIVFLPQKVLP